MSRELGLLVPDATKIVADVAATRGVAAAKGNKADGVVEDE
jgi:hypothetical protein